MQHKQYQLYEVKPGLLFLPETGNGLFVLASATKEHDRKCDVYSETVEGADYFWNGFSDCSYIGIPLEV